LRGSGDGGDGFSNGGLNDLSGNFRGGGSGSGVDVLSLVESSSSGFNLGGDDIFDFFSGNGGGFGDEEKDCGVVAFTDSDVFNIGNFSGVFDDGGFSDGRGGVVLSKVASLVVSVVSFDGSSAHDGAGEDKGNNKGGSHFLELIALDWHRWKT